MDPALKESKLWAETLDDSSDEEDIEDNERPPRKSWFGGIFGGSATKVTPGTELGTANGTNGTNGANAGQKEESLLSGPMYWILLLLFLLLLAYLAWYGYQYLYGKENETTDGANGKDIHQETNPVGSNGNSKVPETNFQVSNTGSVVARVVR